MNDEIIRKAVKESKYATATVKYSKHPRILVIPSQMVNSLNPKDEFHNRYMPC